MATDLNHRYDMCLIFDVENGNPNGDPDAGNMPRVDPETLHGLVSDVCQKRKVRDFVISRHEGQAGMQVFFQHKVVLNRQIVEAYDLVLEKAKQEAAQDSQKKVKDLEKELLRDNPDRARAHLCATRWDIRTFGAVLSTGDKEENVRKNAGQVRGPVQCTFGTSIDPVLAMDLTITRKSVTNEKQAQEQINKDGEITGTMGRKALIPYGLYRSYWFVNPKLAAQTGFSRADFRVLCDALLGMFEEDRSASRGFMATRGLIVFQHESDLGNAPAHRLFERVKMARKDGEKPARAFSDYRLETDRTNLPEGITVFDLADPAEYRNLFAP